MTDTPEMTDLYRRLFDQLSTKFGGSVNEANADAIAYVAAELYHDEFEPRLWEEKSAHDVLDALGVPRAGVFAPYTLSERLLALQRRVGPSESAKRAHDLLDGLGVPKEDEDGRELTLRQRIDRFRSAAPLAAVVADAPPISGNGAGHKGEPDPAPERNPAADGQSDDAGDDGQSENNPGEADDKGEAEGGSGVDVVDVADSPGAAPLVEAVRALEEAARVEAESPHNSGPTVDVAQLSETLSELKDEVAALRTLVESLATDMRERLEAVHEEVLVLTGKLEPTDKVVVLPQALEQTADIPPVLASPDEPAPDESKRRRRRVWLVVLLVVVALLLAGVIVLTVVFGWDTLRDEISGLVAVPVPAGLVSPQGATP
ncbi:MAG TPA: hypothetical protein VF045_03235 [Acidimicrobiales bacterium]